MIGKLKAWARMNGGPALPALALGLATSPFGAVALAQSATVGGAEAQQEILAEEGAKSVETSSDIVVTGTLIRGIAPAGSNTISISNQDAKLSGVIDQNAMLTQLVPQSEGFMDLGRMQPGNGGNNAQGLTRVPVVRPSLRNLGDSFQGSGSPTLVLLDGHRIVPAGIEQSVVDIGSIPPGILDRTEIVLDGTSAVYGSDAVGGTINYVPRKRFEETRVAATYGFADDYYAVSADISSGVEWEGGGLAFSYSFGKNDDLLVGDRDWTIPRNWLDGERLTGLACEDYGHISVGARRFLTTTLEERTDWCELGYASTVQALERHSGFVVFSQDVSDNIKFEVTGFYSQRATQANGGPFVTTGTVRSTNPYYRQVPGTADNAQQSVAFQWGPIFGNDAQETEATLRLGQVSPSLTFDLGNDWQVRAMGSYGKSQSTVEQSRIDTILVNRYLGGTTLDTAINPYDIGATQQRVLFGSLLWRDHRDGIHDFYQARVVADGPLFTMPGGEARVAVGAEWNKTSFRRRITDQATHIVGPYNSASVTNKAVFGEVNLPLVSEQNSMALVQALTLSASGRYDHYDRTGGTFNPKFAVTYKPIGWVTVRGNWGKSFRAPNAVDRLGASANTIGCSSNVDIAGCNNIGNFFTVPDPQYGVTLDPNRPNVLISLAGVAANVEPETSTNWSIGLDLRPPVLPGLQISASYFYVKFKNQIRFPPTNVNDKIVGAPDTVILNPTQAQIDQFAQLGNGGDIVAQLIQQNNYNVLYLTDGSITNLASVEVDGLDASVLYVHQTGFGSLNAAFNGTWRLKENSRTTPLAPVIDALRVGVPLFRMTATAGATVGNFRGQVSFQHRSGFDVDPAANRDPAQTRIDSYQLWNASLRYDFQGQGLAENLGLSVVVNNIFNSAPPVNRLTTGSTINGSTLGRYIQIGIDKAF